MDKQTDGLWKGGPWEQPSPAFPAPPPIRFSARRQPPLLRPRRRKRTWPWLAGLAGLILLLCALTILLEQQLALRGSFRDYFPFAGQEESLPLEDSLSDEPPSIPRAEPGDVELTIHPAGGAPLELTGIYEKNLPSLVSITSDHGRFYNTGSGIVLTGDGYLLTNAHVVAGAREVSVQLWDNRVFSASWVGFDAKEDLAVLKIDAQGLTPAEFGDSNALRIGEPAYALGDSLGYRATFTDGIISALEREMTVEGADMVLLQASAAINFGNSGGPLLNQYGQVVGINTVKIVTDDGSAEALGFAIPSSRVKYVADRLLAGLEVRTAAFGFTVNTVEAEGGGLVLLEVDPVSDAHRQGLLPGDVILRAGGQPIHSTQDLTRLKLALGPGDTVALTCLREGEEFTVEVALIDAELIP